MAYLQTTATSTSDILNAIATFASGLGWTVERNNTFTSGANNQRILTLSRAGFDYAHFFEPLTSTTKTDIRTRRSIGVNLTGNDDSQVDKGPYSSTTLLTGGPYVAMWLFGESGSNPYIHVVVEHTAGRYRHFGIGELIKKGVWTGGSYCHGTYMVNGVSYSYSIFDPRHAKPFTSSVLSSYFHGSNGGVRCDNLSGTSHGITGIDQRYVPYHYYASKSCESGFVGDDNTLGFPQVSFGLGLSDANKMLSVYNQRTNLLRLNHYVTDAGYRRFIGEPPAVRGCSVSTFEAGQEFVIGSDTWKIFPLVSKTYVNTTTEHSGHIGLAYKKVV